MFKKLFNIQYSLFTILVIAAILRLWNLGNIPPHLTSDEAALGYNAYSILKTGRDEYGEFLPLIFKSFGDYKPGLYVYAAVPSIAIFGLNEFATRLPGAISGIFAVWLLYLVVKELFVNHKTDQVARYAPLAASFVLAISPWHIHFSRGAWEVGLALTLTLGGIYCFLRAMRGGKRWLVVAAVLFSLTLLVYQGAKMSTSLVMLGLILVYWKEIRKTNLKTIIASIIVVLMISAPVVLSVFSGKTGRLEVFSVFSYPRPEGVLQEILDEGNENRKSWEYIFYHSESLNFFRGILGRWMNHYSGRFLFFEGDWANPRHSAPYSGMLFLADIFLLVVGFVWFARNLCTKGTLFIGYWLLVAPIPAALSRDAIHAVRAFYEVIPLVILLGGGLIVVWQSAKTKFARFVVMSVLVLSYMLSFIYWLDQYTVHLSAHNANFWEYGYREAVNELTLIQGKYKEIVFVQSFDQPYIYALFYQKYDPRKYQQSARLVQSFLGPNDVGIIEKLDNISFSPIDWPSHRVRKGVLFIGTPEQIPPNDSSDPSLFKVHKEIHYPNGQIAFRFVEVL